VRGESQTSHYRRIASIRTVSEVRPAYDPSIGLLAAAAVCRAAGRAACDVADHFLAMLEIAASSYKVPGRHTRYRDLAGCPFARQWVWSGSSMELQSPPRPHARRNSSPLALRPASRRSEARGDAHRIGEEPWNGSVSILRQAIPLSSRSP
jgi:hypothetical protein